MEEKGKERNETWGAEKRNNIRTISESP